MKSKHELLIHIGTMKTGTTALQRFLAENNAEIQKYGWCYPDLRNEIQGFDFEQVETTNEGKIWAKYINARVVRMFYENEKRISEEQKEQLWQEMWEVLDKHLEVSNVILSDERFWFSCSKDLYRKIKSRYENVKLVVYLRRQDRYIESYWNQRVKRLASFSEDFHDILNRGGLSCAYLERLEELEEIFGLENIVVRSYEKGQFEGVRKDVVSDFFSIIGVEPDWDKCVSVVSENESLSGNYLEIKRILNMTMTDGEPASEKMNDIFHQILSEQKSNKITHIEGYFTLKERKAFLESVKTENEIIAKKYLKREDGILFYDMNMDIPEYSVDNNIYEDIIKTFGVYLREMQEQILNLQKN